MARKVTEIDINSETSREDLELCAAAADRTSDPNMQRIAARANAEIWRRDQQLWINRFNAESEERVKAQRFQETQITRQIEAQNDLMGKQLEVAKEQAEAAKGAAQAAQQSAQATQQTARATIALAIVTAALVIVTAILAVIAAITLFSA